MFRAFEFCLPTRATAVPAGPDWFHEIKYDGYRLRVDRDGDRAAAARAPVARKKSPSPRCATAFRWPRVSPLLSQQIRQCRVSSMASASSRFSRVFSSSNVFSRLASETSIPPNLAFDLYILASLTPCLRHASATETP